MNRRRFLKDAAQAGVGLGVSGSLRTESSQAVPASRQGGGKGAAQPTGKPGDVAPHAHLIVGTPVISLSGEWALAKDMQNVGRAQQWYARELSDAQPVRVPGALQETFPAYHGVVWYCRDFVAPTHPHQAGRYLLRFGAVDYLADVWVNGMHLGGHEGGETPSVLDATKAVKPGARNRLTVRVLNPGNERIDGIVLAETPHRNKVVPYTNGSTYNYGGILEPVELLLAPAVRVEDLHVYPDPKTGKIRVQVQVRNTLAQSVHGQLQISVAPVAVAETLAVKDAERELAAGETPIETEIQVENPQLWDLETPYLYRVTVRLSSAGTRSADETSVRCGFRDFRIERGYFRLNGKRIFVRSSHTGNITPIGQVVDPDQAPDLLRRDMLYAKACGFNMVRFISGIAHPYQLDLCDEIGLMVYEESLAGWVLGDSPKMKERYDLSVREMVLRDRNHPSVTIWGMLNETVDGPVFRHAVESLKLVRALDKTRLVLLGSGRFDGQRNIGSASNPGSSEWEYVWGNEAPGAPAVKEGSFADYYSKGILWDYANMGDIHFYPEAPQPPAAEYQIRRVGQGGNPVFLSEYGIGSLMNVIRKAAMYEQVGARPDLEDYEFMRSMAERLVADWTRWKMDSAYAFPEDLLEDSERRMARHRRIGFDMIRSNPMLCGFSLTGLLDHGMSGEGVWRLWRDWKPGTMDAMQDGWWPLRWCLFVEPTHSYAGRPFKVEAVLATEDVLKPGEYPAQFRICGPHGTVWEQRSTVRIPEPPTGKDGPLAVPVLNEQVTLNAPAGVYQLVANLEKGGAPMGRTLEFYLSGTTSLPQLDQTVTVWGIGNKAESWLKAHGVKCASWGSPAPDHRELILVGDISQAGANATDWQELARRMARGSTAVFLSPLAFQKEKDSVAWLPLAKKGRCYKFGDWLYHKECVAKVHPLFEGLPSKGILDWYYYTRVVPQYLFDGQEPPDDVAAAAFATGYPPGGYASGILLGSYVFGAGRFILNTFPVLEHLDAQPTADRLLLNLVKYAGGAIGKPPAELPADFDAQLKTIGYAT